MFKKVSKRIFLGKLSVSVVATAVIVTVISIAGSMLVAFQLVASESLKSELDFVSDVTSELIRHGDKVSTQLNDAFEALHHSTFLPCSDESIALMRSLALRSSQIQMIGFSQHKQVICSSMGLHKQNVFLGDADFYWQSGIQIHRSHEFPTLAAGLKLIVAQRYGYMIAVLPELPIDIMLTQGDLSLGIYGIKAGQILTGRGTFSSAWMPKLRGADHVAFSDGENIVALRRSDRNDFIAYTAIPVTHLNGRLGRIAFLFIPLCLIASVFFSIVLTLLAIHYLSAKSSLYGALKRNELFVLYQPIVDLHTRRWVGAEALVRWRRADGSLVGPEVFIPLAEEHRIIQKITQRVISLVFRDAPDFLRIAPNFHISINLSSADLQSENLVAQLQGELQRASLPAQFLHLEATERGFVNTASGRKVIHDLRALGIAVAIDDFGTGYSSLSYLEAFELDYLKIDKSFISVFVNEQGEINPDSQMTSHIIDIAKSLQLQMIAEGVENENQAAQLHRRGVQFAQGWLFGKPMSAAEAITRLMGFRPPNVLPKVK